MNSNTGRFRIESFFFLASMALFLVILTGFILAMRKGDGRMRQAEENYRKGEGASTIAERNEFFNSALPLFLDLEAAYHPYFGDGKLYYDIGNTYFQLGEYPLSILYYLKAEKLMPRSEAVKSNLSEARRKVGLESHEKEDLLDLLLLKNYFSLPERIQLFFALAFLTLVVSSLLIWYEKQGLSNAALICFVSAALVLTNLGLSYYFSPIEGVLIHAAELLRDSRKDAAKVNDLPIQGGSVVEVVGTSENGKWLKVAAPNAEFGFLPSESIRLVSP